MADSGSAPGSADVPFAGPAGGHVPPAVLRSWDQAEARLFPLVTARPDLYRQAISMIQQLLARLRETCPDLPSLLAAHERGGGLATAELAGGAAEIRPELVAAAACAMRYRELAASLAVKARLAALSRARDQGLAWAVVEETGSQDRAPYVPYQRIEAEVASGRALIVSIEPDETLSRAVHRLDRGEIDLVTGALRVGEPAGSYLDPDAFAAALQAARGTGGAPPA